MLKGGEVDQRCVRKTVVLLFEKLKHFQHGLFMNSKQAFIYTLRIHIIPLKPQNNNFKVAMW